MWWLRMWLQSIKQQKQGSVTLVLRNDSLNSILDLFSLGEIDAFPIPLYYSFRDPDIHFL